MRLENFKIILLVLIGSLLSVSSVYAETIVLKSGKSVEGKLLEKTDKYIKIDFQGVPVTYYFDEIESIDGVKQTQSSLVKNNLSQENNPPSRSETAEHDSGIEYYNKEYGIKIRHPKEWEVFDRNLHPEVFKTLLAIKIPVNNIDLICALSCSKDLNPVIMVVVQSFPDSSKDLSVEDLAKSMDQNLRQASLPQGENIIEYPKVIKVGSRKLVRCIVNRIEQGKEFKCVIYAFIKGAKHYMFTDTADLAMFDSYNKTFEDIVIFPRKSGHKEELVLA